MDNHIMSEQERVRGLQIVFLKTQTRLTLPFDGGAVRRGEYFYTFHANTADGRSFLLEGLDCTGVSHTAQWMAKAAMEVMNYVAVENFIGASSDSTGNTKGCRRILCEQVPTFLDLPDPNHHLSLTCKVILLLPFFKLKIGRGLESIGKTRFASVTWSSISVGRNLNPMRGLSTSGLIEIKKYNDYFTTGTQKTLAFEMQLNQLSSVTEGIARAIQCLEAQECNPADIYLLWLAVTAHVRAALRDTMIPENVCKEIRGIINHRWKEFFVTNLEHEVYLAAFYLNPKYLNSSIFKRPNAVAPPTITIPGTPTIEVAVGVQNANTFSTLEDIVWVKNLKIVNRFFESRFGGFGSRALDLANRTMACSKRFNSFIVTSRTSRICSKSCAADWLQIIKEAHTSLRRPSRRSTTAWTRISSHSRGGNALSAINSRSSMQHMMGAFPFNKPLGKTHPLDWWRALEGTERGGILASWALKLYPAVPNSMADERTVSVVTWINSPLRNQVKVDTIFSFDHFRGWYRDEDKQKAMSAGTAKTRKAARPLPEVKFYNIERDIHSDDEEMEEDDDVLDSEDKLEAIAGSSGASSAAMPRTDWLDLPREVFASSTALDLELGEVNLDSVLLEVVSADHPSSARVRPVTYRAVHASPYYMAFVGRETEKGQKKGVKKARKKGNRE
ncbi:ribonuclease H-like domain-containing protein [Mycena sp. CBHHK59/15]|nr:ribonuclease H-like domain-containing protein [Mycena sp. CBHHK59/15]